jgi:hypothetical protein
MRQNRFNGLAEVWNVITPPKRLKPFSSSRTAITRLKPGANARKSELKLARETPVLLIFPATSRLPASTLHCKVEP